MTGKYKISGGLSGCILSVDENDVVEKKSHSLDYNQRLLDQAKKQIAFKKINGNIFFDAPEVYETGIKEDGLSYFKMPYIRGMGYKDFLNYSSSENISFFTDSLINYFDSINIEYGKYDDASFKKKCLDKIGSLESYIKDQSFFSYFSKRIQFLENCKIGPSFCHGDLTLSNIIFGDNKNYLLDFLDSFIETWIIDLIKIKQDLFYFWSLKIQNNYINNRESQISNFIWRSLEVRFKDIIETEEFKILETINFLRILPYMKNERDMEVLEDILEKTPIYEEFNNSYGRKIFQISGD